MITIQRYFDRNRAISDQAYLEASGIPVFLKDENSALLGAGAVGLAAIELQTSPEHFAEARSLLGLPTEFPEPSAPPSAPGIRWSTVGFCLVASSLIAAALSLLLGAGTRAWLGLWILSLIGILAAFPLFGESVGRASESSDEPPSA